MSGLAPETTYDLYLVLEDASKNVSTVGKMQVTTKSVLPPVAAMAFEARFQDQDPTVGSVVRIEFNKPVKAGSEGVALELIKMQQTQQVGMLKDFIKLYQIDPLQKTRSAIEINFDAVTISEPLGYTVISFPTGAAEGGGVAAVMESGGEYQFDLTGFWDLANLAMLQPFVDEENRPTARIKSFMMRPPSVVLTDLSGMAAQADDYHIMFEVKRENDPEEGSANQLLMYDTVLETNRSILFDVYDLDSKETPKKPVLTDILMVPGDFYMMAEWERQSASGKDLGKSLQNPEFELFNTFKAKRYGIKIKRLDGSDSEENWDGSVIISVFGVTGFSRDLIRLNNYYYIGEKEKYPGFENLPDDRPATVVGVMRPPCEAPFRDRTLPVITAPGPIVVPADTNAMITGVTDKPAWIYYFMIPKTDFNPANPPTDIGLMSLAYSGREKCASGRIDAPGFRFEEIAKGLVTNTDYIMFYVVTLPKSSSPSEVKTVEFATGPAEKPRYNVIRTDPGEGKVTLTVNVGYEENGARKGASADIYWIATPIGTFLQDPYTPPAGYNAPQIAQIVHPSATEDADIFYGNVMNVAPHQSPQAGVQITINGLKKNVNYEVFLTAVNPLAEHDEISNYVAPPERVQTMPRNPDAPMLSSIRTSSLEQAVDGSYSGFVTVTFTDGLYWRGKDGASSIQPLRASDIISGGKLIGEVMFQIPPGINTSQAAAISDGGSEAVISFSFAFSGVRGRSSIGFGKQLMSSAGKTLGGVGKTGQFDLIFNPSNEESPWSLEFL